jgi:hypothetical protein
MHIRASSDNPRKILLAIGDFVGWGNQCRMRRLQNGIACSDPQDVYKMNLDALIALKTKLMNGDVNWNDVAPRLMDWII